MFNSKEKRVIAGQIAMRIAYAAIVLAAWTTLYYGLGEWIGLLLTSWTKNADAKGLNALLNFITSCLVLRLAVISVVPSSTTERRFSALKQYVNFYFLSQGIVHMVKLYNSANTNVPQEIIIASGFIGAIVVLRLAMRTINAYVTNKTARAFVGADPTNDDSLFGKLSAFATTDDEKDIDEFFTTINDSQDLIADNYKPYVDMLDLELTKTKTLDGNVTGSISCILGFKMFRNSKHKWLRAFHFPLTGILEPISFKTVIRPKPLGKAILVEHSNTEKD